jgi:hypothetical protein
MIEIGKMPAMSGETKELDMALLKAKQQFPAIGKDKAGYGYNYATLDQILDTVIPILHRNGLDLDQLEYDCDKDCQAVITRITHVETGQWKTSGAKVMQMSQKKGMSLEQSSGSADTYVRRYQLAKFLALSIAEDTDASMQTRAAAVDKAEVAEESAGLDRSTMIQDIKELCVQIEQTGKAPSANMLATVLDNCNKNVKSKAESIEKVSTSLLKRALPWCQKQLAKAQEAMGVGPDHPLITQILGVCDEIDRIKGSDPGTALDDAIRGKSAQLKGEYTELGQFKESQLEKMLSQAHSALDYAVNG